MNDNSRLFSLSRKRDRLKVRKKRSLARYINSIVETSSKECQCITVSREDGLYMTNNFIVTHNSFICGNMGINIAYKGVPALLLDTEMSEEEQLDRILARMANIETKNIERGVPGHTPEQKQALIEAARKLKDLPLDYKVIRGMEFEEVLAFTRRWIHKNVGFMPDGKSKPCVLVYDYLKLLDNKSITKNQSEFQSLGFMTNSLKNFVGKYAVGSLVTAQTNREGVDGEDDRAIAGSDRIGWFATSIALYKRKTEEERMELVPIKANKYTHKIIPLETRWGERFDQNDYINIEATYEFGRMKEGPSSMELSKQLLRSSGPPKQPKKDGEATTKSEEPVNVTLSF
jgi:DnaB-like helicase C terminal domain